MIPLSEIVSRVQTEYYIDTANRWAFNDVRDSINEGLDELSEATRFYERHVSVPITSLATYYDLRGWLPENALGVTSVWSTVRQDWLRPATFIDLGQQWRKAVGPSQRFWMRGLWWMGVWPKADVSATGTFRVYFSALAPHYDFPQAVLRDLPDHFTFALEDYALYDLAAQDGEADLALRHFSDYQKREDALKAFVNRRNVTARYLRMGSMA